MSNCQDWCRWLLCCECFVKKNTDGTGLLPGKGLVEDSPKSTRYYTVRRISRVGYASSREDINDSCSDLGATGEPLGACPVDMWTEPVQPDVRDTALDALDVPVERLKGRWHSALHVLQPKRSKSKERRKFNVPVITLSSPDIVQDLKKESKQAVREPKEVKSARWDYSIMADDSTITSLGTAQDHWSRSQSMQQVQDSKKESKQVLRDAKEVKKPRWEYSIMADGSTITSLGTPQDRWSRSQSLQNINSSSTLVLEPIDNPPHVETSDTDSTLLARSFGLEKSLYMSYDTKYNKLQESKSTDTLQSLWHTTKESAGECFTDQPHGAVEFSAFYNLKNKKLLIHVSRVLNLPPIGRNRVYDVVVKLSVLPNDKHSKTTRVLKGSRSLSVDEDFHFPIKEPAGKLLRISVFNAEAQGKYDAVGNALFNLEDVITGRPRNYSMRLYKQTQPNVCPGNIEVCLRYQSQENVFSVVVVQASNLSISHVLKKQRHSDKYNTFVKVTFFCSGQKVKSRKSNMVVSDKNPRYNYSTEFRVSPEYSEDCYLVVSIMTKELLRKDLALGRVVLGPHFYAEGQNITPWGRAFLKHESVSHGFRMYL